MVLRKDKKIFKTNLAYVSCIVFTIFIPVFSFIRRCIRTNLLFIFWFIFYIFYRVARSLIFRNSIKFGAICFVVYSLKATGLFLLITSILFLITKKCLIKDFFLGAF